MSENLLEVPSIIDIELWTRAGLSGVAFLAPEDGPPGLGIIFDDADAGAAIFAQWRTDLGPEDVDELVRVAIIEGDVPGKQPGYTLRLEVDLDSVYQALATRDLDGTIVDATGLGSVQRRMHTPPGGSPPLARWKELFAAAKVYALVPVLDEGDGPEPAYELQLIKRKLVFEQASATEPSATEDASEPSPAGGAPTVTLTAEQLRAWSELFCTLPAMDLDGALSALGIPGALVARSRDYSIVEPPPPGTSRLGLTREHLGKNRGNFGVLEVTPAPATITRAELDHRFGPGDELSQIGLDQPQVISYDVDVADAPFHCTVFAHFSDDPTPGSLVTQIEMRRDPVRPPAPT